MNRRGRPPREGISNWVPFLDAVDDARRTRSFGGLRALYSRSRRTREKSLLNATACALAAEFQQPPPWWAMHPLTLPEPWFVAGIENLKATALVESPLPFRRNNIFVLGNFLSRA
ncbi:MAG: hypothetical protein M3Y79_08955 [Pseudomonadota bacterium]|nr:hypothetical protein [Pseudomonadota bacterium]